MYVKDDVSVHIVVCTVRVCVHLYVCVSRK